MSNGIRSLPRYQTGGSSDPDQEERRRRLWQLMTERRGAPESPDPDLSKYYQDININEDRMENLLDSLNALVGGDVAVHRSIEHPTAAGWIGEKISGSQTYPGGLAIWPSTSLSTSELLFPADTSYLHDLPLSARWEEYMRGQPPSSLKYDSPSRWSGSPFSAENQPSDRPYSPHHGTESLFLVGAGDRGSREAGTGFEIDPSGRPMTEEWSPAERFTSMHEFGHLAHLRNIVPESLERMQEESSAPMYPWHYMGGDEEGGREPPRWQRALRALEAKIAGLYKPEKFATQFGKAVEILQDSLDPERRSEAIGRVDSPEMKELVERLLEHPVYESHPLRQRNRQ